METLKNNLAPKVILTITTGKEPLKRTMTFTGILSMQKALTFQESIYPYHNCLVYGLALQSVVFLYCIAYKSELRENLTYAFPLVVKQGAKVPSEIREVRN